jgi:hypothetical protein
MLEGSSSGSMTEPSTAASTSALGGPNLRGDGARPWAKRPDSKCRSSSCRNEIKLDRKPKELLFILFAFYLYFSYSFSYLFNFLVFFFFYSFSYRTYFLLQFGFFCPEGGRNLKWVALGAVNPPRAPGVRYLRYLCSGCMYEERRDVCQPRKPWIGWTTLDSPFSSCRTRPACSLPATNAM